MANPNTDIEQEAKRKVMMIAFPLLGGAYLLSSLLCTYLVAMDVDFNPMLGGWTIFGLHFYSPFAYGDWRENIEISKAIPDILNSYKWYRVGIMAVAIAIVYFVNQAYKRDISHGSAEFATNKDITLSDLGHYVTKNGGVLEKDEHTGGIYESYGRGWLIQIPDEKEEILKEGDWNTMRILCQGDRVQTWLNGEPMVDIRDEKIGAGNGRIALQIHDGGGIKVRWRNLHVKTL